MRIVKQIFIVVTFLAYALSIAAAQTIANQPIANQPMDSLQTPHEVVKTITIDLISVITEAQGYFDKDPQRFYQTIENLISPIFNFNNFGRSVMGRYASSKRYQALQTEEEKKQFEDKIDRFGLKFKNGLVKTFSKGLLAFGGQKIEVIPPSESDKIKIKAGGAVKVIQYIHSTSEKPFVIEYKMRKNKENQWIVRNVTIETVNFGKIYRSQFYSAMRKHENDMDKVIETWTVAAQSFEKKKS